MISNLKNLHHSNNCYGMRFLENSENRLIKQNEKVFANQNIGETHGPNAMLKTIIFYILITPIVVLCQDQSITSRE